MPDTISDLSSPDDVCLCPLHTPAFNSLVIRWFTHEYETELRTRRRICCHRPTAARFVNGMLAPPTLQPFVFELIGQISEHDCHLTTDGYGDRTEAPVASCWIEACPGHVSRIEWAQSAASIHRILDSIREPWSADALAMEGDPIRYQLFFEPPEGTTLQQTLPVYERNGPRRPPTSISEVPFGRVMRFLFTIHYSRELTSLTSEPEPRMVFAQMFSLRCL